MKNIWMSKLLVCGMLFCSYGVADSDSSAVAPTAVAPVCFLSEEEQSFSDSLSEVNKTVFCGMTSEERSECMQMAGQMDELGNPISPDQAVARVLGAGNCPGS